MDMDMMGHGGHAGHGGGIPLENFHIAFWALIGSAIGVAALVNIANYALYRQR